MACRRRPIRAVQRRARGRRTRRRRGAGAPLHAADVADLLEQLSPIERSGWSPASGRTRSRDLQSISTRRCARRCSSCWARRIARLAAAAPERRRHRRCSRTSTQASRWRSSPRCRPPTAPPRAGPGLPGGERRPPDAARAGGRARRTGRSARPSTILRASDDLPDDFYDIFIVDPRYRPVGAVPLSQVMRSRGAPSLTELDERRATHRSR